MRQGDNYRGGSGRGGRGRSDRNSRGNSRGRGGRKGGGGGRGRSGGRQGSYRNSRGGSSAAESGNQRERIQVESGFLVLIDQFMLANPQFLEQLNHLIDEAPEAKDDLILKYGGTVVKLSPTTYKIARDPFASRIVVHQQGENFDNDQLGPSNGDKMGEVFVDTRCLAMVDRELLDDIALLEKYQQLWLGGQDKACRDLLRDNGGAVRYGFERYGDELAVYKSPDADLVCLCPSSIQPETEEQTAES